MEMKNGIVDIAEKQLLSLYNQANVNRLVYHDFKMLAQTAQLVFDIAAASPSISDEEMEAVQLAAWFQYASLLSDKKLNAEKSIEAARSCLENTHYPEQGIALVERAIREVHGSRFIQSEVAQLLNDANVAYAYTSHYQNLNPLKRLEEEVLNNERLENLQWEQDSHQQLFAQRFYLSFSKKEYEGLLSQNILEQEARIQNLVRKKQRSDVLGQGLRKFQGLERKLPERATQTFFRANYRNHINLSSIADNKANIMIGINAIMMTIVVSVLSYGNIAFERPIILMPVVMFLFTGLASMISAVLSARPKVTMLNPEGSSVEEAKKNLVFFGNFVHLSEAEYESAMDAVLRDSELMYGNMVRDLYHLGKVLDKKYRLLTLSYNIFMLGFVATMLAFLIAFYLY